MALFNLSKDISDFGAGTWDLDLAVDPANFLDDCSNLLRLGFVEWLGLGLAPALVYPFSSVILPRVCGIQPVLQYLSHNGYVW